MKCIILLLYFITKCICLIPEVSQEGLLQPYVTYSDVTLFHYHVPEEVTRVTWEFAAFMDDPNCPIRDVHVLVQHGSYPVVSTYNGTFPSYMYNQRSSLHKVITRSAFPPHNATILPVYNPLPGSWFAAAYIPNWNEQMQQEGIIHKCRYSLGSIAMWSQKDKIDTLNIGASQIVTTRENFAYFRFYVPSHTWVLHVNLSNCRVITDLVTRDEGKNSSRWCLKSAKLRARALPHFDMGLSEGGIVNVTDGGGHLFVEKHPFTDSYYYLLLYTEGETTVEISINTRECGGILKQMHNHFRGPRSQLLSDYSINSTTLHNSSESLSSNSLMDEWRIAENEDHQCYPILPLARIKHASDFTDTFLIQGPEWYSTWVSVRADMPVYTRLTLLPYTDIGGTLSINLHLDDLLVNSTKQLITVIGCVSKGRPPLIKGTDVACEDNLILNITSKSDETIEQFVLIPFPEPDVWYLALHVLCYYKGKLSSCVLNNDNVLVSIDVRTQPCVYTGDRPCGDHGTCQETHRGMFFFSSCECREGWRGWGCHDGEQAQHWITFVSGLFLLTISNIFFLPPAVVAFRRKLYAQSLLFVATMIASVVYHTCDNQILSICLTRYEVLQFTDFLFSLMCFWVTVVGLGGMSEKWTPALHILGVVIIAPSVQYSRTALASFAIPMGIALAIPFGHITYNIFFNKNWPNFTPQTLICRIIGIILASFGLIMFALIQTKDNYKYVHSLWHMIIALSLVFLLPSNDQMHKHVNNLQPSPLNDDDPLIDVTPLVDVDYTANNHEISQSVQLLMSFGE